MRFTLALDTIEAVGGWATSVILLIVVIILTVSIVRIRRSPESQHPESRASRSPASQSPVTTSRRFTISTWLIIGVFFAAFLLVGAALQLGRSQNSHDTIIIPLLLIAGVLILIDAVAVLVVIFMRHGLANRDYALALPDGSIRAIIALALIVLFAVLAVYLYANAGMAQADLAKQLVTTLSTLIVALASFYFGSSTTASAHEKAGNKKPQAPDRASMLDAGGPLPSTSGDTPKEMCNDAPKDPCKVTLKARLKKRLRRLLSP